MSQLRRFLLRSVEPVEEFTYDWYLRLVELRKQGHFSAIYHDDGVYALGKNPFAPWASREIYTVKELKALVKKLEGETAFRREVA